MNNLAVVDRAAMIVDGGINRVGQVSAVNILTATPRGRRWRRQRRQLRKAALPSWFVHDVAGQSTPAARLKAFDFLHSATWVDVDRFPTYYRSPEESDQWHWMLFCSNFDEAWHTYLDGFLDAFASGVGAFWGGSVDFPAFPGPGTRYDLKAWLRTRLVENELYYAAYGAATAHDVRAALRVGRELRPGMDPTELERWVARRAECFASIGGPIERSARRLPWATGNTNLVSLVPIRPGAEDDVRASMARARRGSWFARVPGVHFARLAVIDRARAALHPHTGVSLRSSWLLFAADFDGRFGDGEAARPIAEPAEARRFLDAVGSVAALRHVWSHCYRYDDDIPLGAYLLPSIVPRLVLYRDYPGSTLGEVIEALDLRQRIIAQVVGTARPVAPRRGRTAPTITAAVPPPGPAPNGSGNPVEPLVP